MKRSSRRKEIARRYRRKSLDKIVTAAILILLTVAAFIPTWVLKAEAVVKVPEVILQEIEEPKEELEMDWNHFTSIYEEDILMVKAEEAKRDEERKKIAESAAKLQIDLAKEAIGIIPSVKWFNTSAYCPCQKCCDKTDGITASQQKAIDWYTVAAGKQYKMGTIIYIPALSHEPNGGWFIVQDRGGAISNEKLDIYFNTHEEALQYGRKTLECYVYEF